MHVIEEQEILSDISVLDDAWGEPQTFALTPPKRGADSGGWAARALEELPEDLRVEHFALLTSGSTGQPRLVVGSRRRAERLALLLHELQEGEAVKQTVVALPLAYCYAFVNQWVWARETGRELLLSAGFGRPGELHDLLEGAAGAMICLVGAQLPLFEQHFPEAAFPGVIRVHFAGGPFPEARLDQVRSLFRNAKVFNNYGCAEAMPRLTVRPVKEGEEGVGIGNPLPGVELEQREDGQLCFRSPYGAVAWVDDVGFHRVGEREWVATGDLGGGQEGGEWRLAGRRGDVFKRYGEKISLPQLLATVHRAWSGEAQLYRERDAHGEEGHVLVLAPAPSEEELRAVLRALRAGHPRTHWPLRIEGSAHMPLLPNGKVDLVALAAKVGHTVHWRQRLG